MTRKISYWRKVWEERGEKAPYEDPINLDGFDSGAGKLTVPQVEYIVKKTKKWLELKKDDVILEAGCGAGMLLGPLSKYVKTAYGVDIAESMVNRAKQFFPQLQVLPAEDNNLPFKDKMFDKVFLFSVFQYFPNLAYARKAVAEIVRVLKGKGIIYIGDVPDKAKEKASDAYRAKLKTPKNLWQSSVKAKLHHQFYEKSFFEKELSRGGFSCQISPQEIPHYGNSPFRFNVIAKSK